MSDEHPRSTETLEQRISQLESDVESLKDALVTIVADLTSGGRNERSRLAAWLPAEWMTPASELFSQKMTR